MRKYQNLWCHVKMTDIPHGQLQILQVKLGDPDVSNSNASVPYEDKLIGVDGEVILLYDKSNEVMLGIGGELPEDAEFIGQCSSKNCVMSNILALMYIYIFENPKHPYL